jgi:L-2,4-diaminobutyric acid acetyltransferase
VVGYRPPPRPDTVFVWQIGVDHAHRGHGLGARLLDELATRATAAGVRWLEATVTPSNEPSRRTFRALAARRGTTCAEEPCFTAAHFPAHGGEVHEEEVRFRIGPL